MNRKYDLVLFFVSFAIVTHIHIERARPGAGGMCNAEAFRVHAIRFALRHSLAAFNANLRWDDFLDGFFIFAVVGINHKRSFRWLLFRTSVTWRWTATSVAATSVVITSTTATVTSTTATNSFTLCFGFLWCRWQVVWLWLATPPLSLRPSKWKFYHASDLGSMVSMAQTMDMA